MLYQYCQEVDKISECPTNKRRSANGQTDVNNTTGQNYLGSTTQLLWDYTMLYRVEGAHTYGDTHVGYLKTPAEFAMTTRPGPTIDPTHLKMMSGLPLFIEESTPFNNTIVDATQDPDPYNSGFGLWGGSRGNLPGDQVTTRHNGGGTIAYMQGHAEIFNAPHGADEYTREAQDLEADDLFVTPAPGGFIPLERRKTQWTLLPNGTHPAWAVRARVRIRLDQLPALIPHTTRSPPQSQACHSAGAVVRHGCSHRTRRNHP